MTPSAASYQKLMDYYGDDAQNPDKLIPELRIFYEPHGGSLGWAMLRSPLVFQVPFTSWKLANESFEFKSKAVEERLAAGNALGALFFYERPYRLHMFMYWLAEKKFSRDEAKEALTELWKDTEMPKQFGYAKLVKLFRRIGFITDEPGMIVPDEVEIYRGVQTNHKHAARGISWTLSSDKARWFARRFSGKGSGGIVYRAKIRKANILAIFMGRSESEIVVDPKGLIDFEVFPA